MSRDRILILVGWVHLLGGIVGLAAPLVPDAVGPRRPAYWYIATVVLYGLSVASGLALLRRRQLARRLATVVEGLQLVAFHTGRFGFLFYSGIQALLLITPTHVSVSANIQVQFGIGPAMNVTEPFLAIDLFTLVMWWILWRARAEPTVQTSVSPAAPSMPERAI